MRFLALVLVVALGSAPLHAGEIPRWERFRGPNGTGTSADKNIPLTFGAKENLLWRVAVPGAGNSSPLVWAKLLFLQSASKDGKQRSLFCFDATDGTLRWQATIPGQSVVSKQ